MQIKHVKMKHALITLHGLGRSLGSFLDEYAIAYESGDLGACDVLIEAVTPTLHEIERQIDLLREGGTIK